MFEVNLFDQQLIAEDLASRTELSLEQAYEEAELVMEAHGEEMREALLRAIGALEYETEFIENAFILDPKEEKEEYAPKPIEEMTLDELWPPEHELQAYMAALQQANQPKKVNEFTRNITDRLDEWAGIFMDELGDTIEETISNMKFFRDEMVNVFRIKEDIADIIISRIAGRMHEIQREHEVAMTTHMAGASRDLAIECMENWEDDQRRDWHHSNPDFWEWAENFDATPSRNFHMPQVNFDHLVENQQVTNEVFIKAYEVLDLYGDMMNWLREQLMKPDLQKDRKIEMLNTMRELRQEVEKKRNMINFLRFGRKLRKLELQDIEKLPRNWASFKHQGFKFMPFPRLDAKSWVILTNKANHILGINKRYDIRQYQAA